MDIKQRIKEAGMTVSEVAARMPRPDGGVGIAQASLSAIINCNPTINKLKDIADILGISLSELVKDESSLTQRIHCPYCGKSIRITLTAEKEEHRHTPIRKTVDLRLNTDDGTKYRYKHPHSREERMAILELQTLPGEDGMVSVLNTNPIDSDGNEVFDIEYDRLMPI